MNTKADLEKIRKSGRISAQALKKALVSAKEGITLLELDTIITDEILSLGGELSFPTVEGYRYASCLTLNDEVVHGIPRDIKLKNGDKLSIDLGTLYQGWHTDCAWSVIVGGEKSKFLTVGEEAMWRGVKKAVVGNRVGDISEAIQQSIEGAGFEVVRALVGHGVGKQLHEDPEIPGFGKAGVGPILMENQTLAIEAIYTEGTKEVVQASDGWTISSSDGSLGGLFEMSVIVGKNKAEVLTDWRYF